MKQWLLRLLPKLRANVWVLIPVLVVVAGIVGAVLITRGGTTRQTAIISAPCAGVEASEFSCWQTRYKAIVASKSPEAAFIDFKKNYDLNPYVKSNCHQIGHVIGRAAALKYKTLTETYKHGDQFCWSGYYHGALETIAHQIGKDKIVSQLNSVCADFLKAKQYSFDHYNCVHGMGHGLMALEGGKLFEALKICDGYEGSWQQESCYSGVFMENVMDEINPGHHSDYLKQDDPLYPCTAVQDRYKQQCYLMQTSHALLVVQYDFDKIFSLCSQVAAPYDATCYQSLGRDISGHSSSDQAQTIERCMRGGTAAARENCFTGAVKDFISYFHSDKPGLSLCAAIPDTSLGVSCKQVATAYYQNF